MLGCKRLNSLIVTFWNFQAFEQLCKDLADVHPAVLLSTVVFGTLGILYFFWSITVSTLAMYINPCSDCMKAATKFKVFCNVISRKRSANQRKKQQNSVYRVKLSPHAKIQLLLNTFKNGRKIKGSFLL